MTLRSALRVLFALLFFPRAAEAQRVDPHPLRFDTEVDAPILAAAGFAWLAGNLMQPAIIARPTCDPCLATDVNAFDRSLAGRRDSIPDKVSWGLLAAALAAPLVADGIDVAHARGTRASFADDAGVYLEALAIDGAITEVVKLTVQRPRPFTYDPSLTAKERAGSDGYASFFSGHTSLSFTAAAAYVTIFALRHRENRLAVAGVAAIALGLAGATSALRIVAGKHFYTDVAVGALVGTAVGVAIPLLHRRRGPLPGLAVVPVEKGALALFTLVR